MRISTQPAGVNGRQSPPTTRQTGAADVLAWRQAARPPRVPGSRRWDAPGPREEWLLRQGYRREADVSVLLTPTPQNLYWMNTADSILRAGEFDMQTGAERGWIEANIHEALSQQLGLVRDLSGARDVQPVYQGWTLVDPQFPGSIRATFRVYVK